MRSPGPLAAGTAQMILVAAAVTALYYLLPAGAVLPAGWWIALFAGGLVILAAVIVLVISRMLAAGAEARIRAIFTVLCAAIIFFAETNYLLAKLPGEFAGLHTRTDGLYFTISMVATVGFGDIHAAGQLARAAVAVQMIFSLVFLASAVAALLAPIKARAARRVRQGGPQP
jgi:voltage-gated potassium channel